MFSSITTSYTSARKNLATLLDRVERENSVALITRKGHEDIAVLPAHELTTLLESLHLLRSPRNAERLFAALEESIERDNLRNEAIIGENLSDLINECQE